MAVEKLKMSTDGPQSWYKKVVDIAKFESDVYFLKFKMATSKWRLKSGKNALTGLKTGFGGY